MPREGEVNRIHRKFGLMTVQRVKINNQAASKRDFTTSKARGNERPKSMPLIFRSILLDRLAFNAGIVPWGGFGSWPQIQST